MPPAEPTAVELGDYLGIIRRRYVVVGGAVLVCLLLGLAYGLSRPDVYRSTAEIALASPGVSRTPNESNADVQTELQVMQSDLVASRAAEDIAGAGDPRDLLAHLTAEAPPDARVLVLTYTAATAEQAQEGAQAFADAYIAQKEAEQRAAIDGEVATYDEQIATVEEGIAEQQEIIDTAADGSRELARAEDARDRLADTLTQLQADRTTVAATRVAGGTIITPARLPRQPRAQGFGRTIAASIAAGLVIGLAGAFVLDRLDTRVRGAADLQRSLGVQALGAIPTFPEGLRRPPGSLVVVQEPDGSAADAFRRLRTSVLLALDTLKPEPGPVTLAITSATTNEGKSTVAANLAVAASKTNRRVLLVAADLYKPGVEALLEAREAPGLSDLLLYKTTLDDALQVVGDVTILARGTPLAFRGVHRQADVPADGGPALLPSSFDGKDYTSATDFIAATLTADVIDGIGQGIRRGGRDVPFDLIIFDMPPVLEAADVLALAPRLDATLLVVSAATTASNPTRLLSRRGHAGASSSAVVEALGELGLAGAQVIGAVINNDPETSRRSTGAAAYSGRTS